MRSVVLCDNSEPEKVLPLCRKYGFGIEIQGFYDPNKTEDKSIISMYSRVLPNNIIKYFHAPFWDLCLGSANKKIADITNFYFDYAYHVAEELDCLGITVHHGFVPHTSYPTNWIKRSIIFWNDFFNSHSGKIKMFMENQCENDTETLIGIVDGCQNNRLSVNLDIGHAHCNSSLAIAEWIRQLGNRIEYVHLHQNYGINDEHLGLRKGNIPLITVLNLLNQYAPEAIWALECAVDEMHNSIEFLTENGYIE
jgi:sugar phosphate isomerase/epimerase